MQPTYEEMQRENKKLSDQVQELTQEVERLERQLYLCQNVIEESKNIHKKSKTVLEETAAKLNQMAKDFEEPIVRAIADHLGATNTMRHYESSSTLPVSTDDSQSDHSKESDSKSSENSDTKTIIQELYLDEMLHPLAQDENTTTKSSHLQLEDLLPNELADSPTSSITSSEMSEYSSQLEPINLTRTRSFNSLGFTYSTEATKSSSEYESDNDQATLRPKTHKKEIVATPMQTGFFNRKNNWPLQADKATLRTGRPATEEPTTKGELIVTEPLTEKEFVADEETPTNEELPAQEETELEKVLRKITGRPLQNKN